MSALAGTSDMAMGGSVMDVTSLSLVWMLGVCCLILKIGREKS